MYKKFLLPSLFCVTSVLLLGTQAVSANEDLPSRRNTFVFVGGESFKLTEKIGPTTVSEDTGWAVTAGLGWSNLFIPTEGAVYRASMTGFVGLSDYECASIPSTCPTSAQSDSRYVGFRFEGMGGYRFGTVIGVELFSGMGIEFWNRSLADGTGTFSGYDTYNAAGTVKMGVSLIQRFNKFGYFLRAGVKAPFAAWQRIDYLDGVEVRPGLQMSIFANLDLTFGTLPRDRFIISIYYDTLNLSRSREKDLTDNGVLVGTLGAPDSQTSRLGAQLVFGF